MKKPNATERILGLSELAVRWALVIVLAAVAVAAIGLLKG
jgi:hypothetical protein